MDRLRQPRVSETHLPCRNGEEGRSIPPSQARPDKLKVLIEDFRPTRREVLTFALPVAICAVVAFVGAYLVA